MTTGFLLLMMAFQGQDTLIEEKFRVDFVLLDVAVVTKSGKPITDLTQSDFEVTEDKRPVPITFFDVLDYDNPKAVTHVAVDAEVATEMENATVVPEKPVQQIIIALDFESVPVNELNKVFTLLEQFLDGLDPQVSYKLNLYAMDRGSLTKGFTTYVDDVKSALATYRDRFQDFRFRKTSFDSDLPGLGGSSVRVGGLHGGNRRGGSNLNNDWADFSDLEDALRDCAKIPGRSGQACQCMSDTVSDYMDQHRIRSERVIGELEVLAYKFDKSEDLKTMLVISPGFVLRRLSSAMEMLDYYMKTANCGDFRSSYFAGDIGLESNFNRVAHACIKNRVIFHSFDVFNTGKQEMRSFSAENRGSAPSSVRSAFTNYNREIVEGLRELAEESGGTYRQVFKLEGVLEKSIQESRFFYSIGYKSPPGKPGKFRNIKVKVNRKGAIVRHRKGYIGS